MAKTKFIYVPRGFNISYHNDEGAVVETELTLNHDYEFRLDDGKVLYATIRNVIPPKSNPGYPTIELDLDIHPGFISVLTKSTEKLSTENIREIKLIHAAYKKANRSYKKDRDGETSIERPSGKNFTFEFKSTRYNSPYRIVAYENEFINLVTSGPNGTRVNNYGCIEDVTNKYIIFNNYVARWGNRSINTGVRIPINNLIGIYRFELGIELFKTKEEKEAEESSEEATILSIE